MSLVRFHLALRSARWCIYVHIDIAVWQRGHILGLCGIESALGPDPLSGCVPCRLDLLTFLHHVH